MNQLHFNFAPLPMHQFLTFMPPRRAPPFFSLRQWRGGAKSGASAQHWEKHKQEEEEYMYISTR